MTIGGQSYRGKLHPSYGKKHTKEAKLKISIHNKGKSVGVNNPNYVQREYYEIHPTPRGNFKSKCERAKWCFDNFEEIDSGEIVSNSGNKKYYYFYRGENFISKNSDYRCFHKYEKIAVDRTQFLNVCKNNMWDYKQFKETHVATKIKSRVKLYTYTFIGSFNNNIITSYTDVVEYYSTHDTYRSTFKRVCRKRGFSYNDFEEVFSRWHYYSNGKRIKKYFYIFIQK